MIPSSHRLLSLSLSLSRLACSKKVPLQVWGLPHAPPLLGTCARLSHLESRITIGLWSYWMPPYFAPVTVLSKRPLTSIRSEGLLAWFVMGRPAMGRQRL